MTKILIIVCTSFFFYSSIEPVTPQDCNPAACPEYLKGHAELGQIPCYLSVLNTRHATATGKCKHCGGDIVFVNKREWVHDTFPKVSGGYIKCADHLAKHVCESSRVKTVAEP